MRRKISVCRSSFVPRFDWSAELRFGAFTLETAVNAMAQRSKDAERKQMGWVAKVNCVHLRGECVGEVKTAGSLCGSASLRLCV